MVISIKVRTLVVILAFKIGIRCLFQMHEDPFSFTYLLGEKKRLLLNMCLDRFWLVPPSLSKGWEGVDLGWGQLLLWLPVATSALLSRTLSVWLHLTAFPFSGMGSYLCVGWWAWSRFGAKFLILQRKVCGYQAFQLSSRTKVSDVLT